MRRSSGWMAGLVVSAFMLASTLPVTAQEATPSITISPAKAGNTAVKHSQIVRIAGSVPEGEVTNVRVLAYHEDGTYEVQPINPNSYNRGPLSADPEANYFLNDGGSLTGQLTLACLFMHPDDGCNEQHVRHASVEISIEGVPIESNKLRVDYLRPYIRGYELIAKNTVLVRFSEPVKHVEDENILDWEVTDPTRLVLNVAGAPDSGCTYLPGEDPTAGDTGCARVLLIPDVGEDDEPFTRYAPVFIRELYEDFASNTLRSTNPEAASRATDKVAPRVPTFDSIDGKATALSAATSGTKRVASTNAQPNVIVKNVTAGHEVSLFQETNGADGLQADDTLLDTEPATGDGAAFTPSFSADGEHILYVTATDTHGNVSPSADTAIFRLDTVAPQPDGAKAIDNKVTVTFTEPLASGRDLGLDWSLDAGDQSIPVLTVTGTGNVRILETLEPVPAGTTVSYTNTDELRYKDEAGNGLAPFTNLITEGLEPKIIDTEPDIAERPVAKVHTLTASVTDQTGMETAGAMVGFRAIDGPTASTDYDGNEETPLGVIGKCLSQSDGTCSLPYTSFELGTDTIQSWIDRDGDLSTVEYAEVEDRDGVGSDEQDVVEVTWTAEGADLILDASPESAAERLVFERTLEVEVLAQVPPPGAPADPLMIGETAQVKGVNVDIRSMSASGLPHLGECFTSGDGTCSIEFSGDGVGVEDIQAWIDTDFDDLADDSDHLSDGYVEDKEADGFLVIDDPSQDVVDVTWALGLRSSKLSGPRITSYGRKVTLKGTVGGDAACRATSVSIVRRIPNRKAKTIKTLKTTSTGRWSYRFKPRFNATYEARSPQSATCAEARSSMKSLKVRTEVTRKVADRILARGQRAVIKGVVRPWKKGRNVELLMRRAGKWKVVDRDRLNKRSRYGFRGYYAKTDARYFKVRYVGDRLNAAKSSPRFKLKVTRYRF